MPNRLTRGKGLFGKVETESLSLAGTAVTATAAELNILDGVTATASELNILDGVTATAAELNNLDGPVAGTVTASKALVVGANKELDTLVIADSGLKLGSGAGTAVTATAAELNLLDGAGTTNTTASKAVILSANKRVISTATAGAAGTNVSAVEYSGDGLNFTSILTLTNVAATIGDNVALAGGALIYTFPTGPIVINSATMSVGLTLTTGTPTTDTPELGLGTTQGSGANATLGDVGAGAENVLGPAVADDCAGTAELLTGAPGLAIETAGAHTLYMNYADTWADVTDTAATLSGTVVLNWARLPLA